MDQEAILRDYKELRRRNTPLNTSLVESLSGDEIKSAADELGMLHGINIDFQTEDEIGVLMDFAIHTVLRDGQNAVARMASENRYPEGSTEFRLLQSLKESRFAMLQVVEAFPGFGVLALNVIDKSPVLLVDLGLSATARPQMVVAARFFSPAQGWWMTTGAALPVYKETLDKVSADVDEFKRRGTLVSEVDYQRIITRACIASGASRTVQYVDTRKLNPRLLTPSLAAPPKVGRNDPCPCGSGMKHKRCCGK